MAPLAPGEREQLGRRGAQGKQEGLAVGGGREGERAARGEVAERGLGQGGVEARDVGADQQDGAVVADEQAGERRRQPLAAGLRERFRPVATTPAVV